MSVEKIHQKTALFIFLEAKTNDSCLPLWGQANRNKYLTYNNKRIFNNDELIFNNNKRIINNNKSMFSENKRMFLTKPVISGPRMTQSCHVITGWQWACGFALRPEKKQEVSTQIRCYFYIFLNTFYVL